MWRTDGGGDLAVMIAEWFAYIADIIAFYNERIANQDCLRTADLDESVNNLIALLGYRPRPAIGAIGAIAALLSPGPTFGGRGVTLPAGLQFQSKPTPGLSPQTFELTSDTLIVAPDQLPAEPPPLLLAEVRTPIQRFSPYRIPIGLGGKGWFEPIFPIRPGEWQLLLQGAVKTIDPGALLRLRVRDGTSGPWLATVVSVNIAPAPSGGGQQTSMVLTLSGDPTPGLSAAQAGLEVSQPAIAGLEQFPGLDQRRDGPSRQPATADPIRRLADVHRRLGIAGAGARPGGFNRGRNLGRERRQRQPADHPARHHDHRGRLFGRHRRNDHAQSDSGPAHPADADEQTCPAGWDTAADPGGVTVRFGLGSPPRRCWTSRSGPGAARRRP